MEGSKLHELDLDELTSLNLAGHATTAVVALLKTICAPVTNTLKGYRELRGGITYHILERVLTRALLNCVYQTYCLPSLTALSTIL